MKNVNEINNWKDVINKVVQGDSMELLYQIPSNSIDLILTDPPYELTNHGGTKSEMAKRAAKVRDEVEFIANGFNYEKYFIEFLRICKTPNIIIFCSNQQISKTMKFFEDRKLSTTLLVWKKTNPSPLCNGKYISDLEFIIYVRGKNATWNNDNPTNIKYKCKNYPFVSPKTRLHPTEKPLKLLSELISLHSKEGQIILDPFMGSWSTAEQAINLKRNFIGCELKQDYCNSGQKRLNKQTS